MQAANSWEERKVALLARLYSLVAHDPTVPAATANFVVRIAGDLTYRQFVALAVLVHHDEHLRGRMRAFMLREEGRAQQDPALLAELDDLGDRRLIVVEGAQGAVGSPSGLFGGGVPPVSALSYGTLRLTDAGEQLVRLTDAGRLIAAEERAAWVEALAVATDE